MGAVESSVAPPPSPRSPQSPNFLSPGRPLYALLNPVENLPTDPDSPFFTALFREYSFFHHQSTKPLASLTSAALDLPAGPHAVALVAALRAAVHRLRTDHEAALLGALLLSTSALADLRRAAPDDHVCLVLGAGIAERSLCPTDRIDLGRSLVARLVTAALHILCGNEVSVTADIAVAAIELLLVALADELFVIPGEKEPLSRLLDRYPSPSSVVLALLQILVDSASHTRTADLLSIGTENVMQYNRSLKRPTGLASVTASASALALQTGFTEAMNALSARFPFASNVNPLAFLQQSSSTNIGMQGQSRTSDVQPESQVLYSLSALKLEPKSPSKIHVPNSPKVPANAISLRTRSSRSPRTRRSENDSTNGSAFSKRMSSSHDSSASSREVSRMHLAQRALVLLVILCEPRPGNPYRETLRELQNKPPKTAGDKEYVWYQFSKLYEAMGRWILHPNGALITYFLFTINRRFRAFSLSRTDPETLLIPLLASLRQRCSVGAVPADAYIPASVLLMMTSDRGFCEAIDEIPVSSSWLKHIEETNRLGSEKIMLSGLVLLVCSRAVQQSLVIRRKEPERFLASICLGVMGNISGNISNLHSVAADRVLSLVEFLGRRRRKVIMLSSQGNEINSSTTTSELKNTLESESMIGFKTQLDSFIGLCLEIIVTVLKSRSSVSANRHLVYSLLHREAVLDNDYINEGSEQTQALGHMLRRVVTFFGRHIDEVINDGIRARDSKQAPASLGAASGNMSVERVFEVIELKARHVPGDVFDGVSEIRFVYEEGNVSEEFLYAYCWSLSTRVCDMFWNIEKSILPLDMTCFKG